MRVLFTALAISTLSFLSGVAGDLAVSSRPSTQSAIARVSLPPIQAAYAPLPEVAPQLIETVDLTSLAAPVLFAAPMASEADEARFEQVALVEPAALIKPTGRGAGLLSKL